MSGSDDGRGVWCWSPPVTASPDDPLIHGATWRLERDEARQQLARAVSSWPSARNVIKAVREGQLGLDALREVVTILDIHLGGQS